jgi:hypothetical protein
MNHIPYQLTDRTLTVVLGTTPHIIHSDNEAFNMAIAVLNDSTLSHDDAVEAIARIVTPVSLIADAVAGDRVTIENNRVLFDGENVPSALTRKLLSVARAGLNIDPWKRFVVRLFANPSRGAQAELNEFLEIADLPITEDGCFLAYKRVRDDYRDLHSATFDNSVGKVVQMERDGVDPDRDRTCSYGLHFCSQDYLRNFYRGGGRIVIVKVNPTDVVSIPSDYQFTKGRTCRYEVVGEVDISVEETKQEWGVYDDSFTLFDEDWNDPLDWDEDNDDDDWDDPFADFPERDYDDTEIVEAVFTSSYPDKPKSRLEALRDKFRRN